MLPRSIHDTHEMILLIAAVYKCNCDHIVYSTDPILMQTISRDEIPFVLLHRTGFTKRFVQNVGLSMESIARQIENVRHHHVSDVIQQLLTAYNTVNKEHQADSDFVETIVTSKSVQLICHPIPSNDIITKCFLITFEENESFYNSDAVVKPQ